MLLSKRLVNVIHVPETAICKHMIVRLIFSRNPARLANVNVSIGFASNRGVENANV